MVTKQEWTRPASCGQGEIFSRSWVGETPQAVLVIAHGMAEHSGRYHHFAAFLAERGLAVYMNDHAGHGKSTQPRGYFGETEGWRAVVDDLDVLMDQAVQRHPGIPQLLMGHSMGSFLSRSYLARYGGRLSGCALCGTMGPNPAVGLGKALAGLQCRVLGTQSCGRLLGFLATGANNRRIKRPVNRSAWLSTVDQVCLDFAADPLCDFSFTAAGYRDLFTGLSQISTAEWARQVPKDLPVFLVAGTEDPVGNYGKGPVQVGRLLRDAGCRRVEEKLYPGMRHEILNERDRDQVYEDLLHFFQSCLKR